MRTKIVILFSFIAFFIQYGFAIKSNQPSIYNKALTYKAQFKIDSAEHYFNTAYYEAIRNNDNLLAINSLLSSADMYYEFGLRNLVMQQLDRVKSLAQKHNLLHSEEYSNYYDLMGHIYLDANAPDFALESYQQSLNIRNKLYPTHDIRLIRSYVNFLNYYYTLWDVENESKYVDIVTFILSKNKDSLYLIDIPEVYNALARCIKTIGTPKQNHFEYYKKARRYLTDGISILKLKQPVNYNKLGRLYHTLANTYVDDIYMYRDANNKKMMVPSMQKANIYYDIAIEYYKMVFRQKHENLARSYFVKGLSLLMIDSNKLALKWFRKSTETSMSINNKTDIGMSNSNKDDLLMSILFHERSLCRLYLKTGNLQYLYEGDYYAKKRVIIWEKMMYEFQSEKKNVILNRYTLNPLQNAARYSYELFLKTNDRSLIETIFQLSEKSKYYTLLKNLQQETTSDSVLLKSNLIKSYQLIIQRRDLLIDRQKISYYSHRDDIVEKQKDSLEILNTLLNNMDVVLQNRFSNYFSAFNRLKMVDLKTVQEMLPNNKTAIVEYFVTDTDIDISTLAITITKDTCFVSHIPITLFEVIKHGNDFQKSIQNSNFENYTEESYFLYQTLVAPCLNPLKNIKKIIFIPDASMSNISFDALITKKPTSLKKDYRNLDYMVKDYEISIQLSVNMMSFLKDKSKNANSSRALFISPKFSSNGFSNLPFSEKSATTLSQHYQGDFLQKEQATKQNFLKSTRGTYDVIHFSTHSSINCSNPLESKLYFSQYQPNDTTNALTLNDIYNSKINADMIVLNSCESNLGFVEYGEGLLNFPRAFLMSGSKSVVSTLWKVDDQSSSEIIISFYEELEKGVEKDAALRNAKLKYLKKAQSSEDANPLYWAGVVVFGDNSPLHLETKNNNIKWYFLFSIATLTIAAGSFLIIRKRKKRF